jgi:hypothetical protein
MATPDLLMATLDNHIAANESSLVQAEQKGQGPRSLDEPMRRPVGDEMGAIQA